MIKIPFNEDWKFRRIEDKSISQIRDGFTGHIENAIRTNAPALADSSIDRDIRINASASTDSSSIDGTGFISENSMSAEVRNIDLPHSFYSDEDQYRGLAVYEKEVVIDPDWRDGNKCLFVDIPAADQHAMVYADETFLTEHKGGYSAFRAEVPCDLLKKQSFILRIFLTNEKNEEISPLAGDFTIYGGLYRGVNLLVTEKSHFDYMYYGTNGIIARTEMKDGDGVIFVEPHVVASENAKIRYTVIPKKNEDELVSSSKAEAHTFRNENSSSDENDTENQKINCDSSPETVLCELNAAGENAELHVISPLIWDGRDNVSLYTLKAELLEDGRVVDIVTLNLGFRSFGMDAENGFFLNGHHLRLNGVAKHQDTADVFNAGTKENIDRDFELIDEIGANAVRLSHYQHPQYTYDLCDEKGYVVWAEIPMLKMPDSGEVFENAEQQLKELILQNIHHPAIFFWGIQNEIGMFRDAPFMYEELRKMRDIAKSLDPSRLVTAANLYSVKFRSELNNITDMIGYNVYFGWYYGEMKDYDKYLDRFHEERPDMPLGMSEYGVDANISLHSEEPKIRDYSEEYQALYHETVYPIFESKHYLWGSFVWNMFDFGSALRKEGGTENRNQKGLVTFDRQTRKDAFFYYKAKWSKEPFVHICSKRFKNRAKDAIDIKVYTNLSEVSLELDGRLMAKENNSGNGVVVFRNVKLTDSENFIRVTGCCNSGKIDSDDAGITLSKETRTNYSSSILSDECTFVKVAEADSSYTLPDSGAGQAVKNWFLEEDTVVREGYYSIEDTANDLLDNPKAHEIMKKHMPELTKLMMEKDIIPLGLTLKSILSRNPGEIDQKALNEELNKVPVEY